MSKFLEKNRKKGFLAAVLFTFRQGRSSGPVVVVASLALILFAMKPSVVLKIPGVSYVAEKLGVTALLNRNKQEGVELKAYQEALNQMYQGVPGYIRRRLAAMNNYKPNPKHSRVKMVSGAYLMEDERQYTYDGVGKERGKSIKGVMTPEDAKKAGDAMPVDEGSLVEGLVNTAFAESIRHSGGGAGDHSGAGGGSGAGEHSNIMMDPGLLVKRDGVKAKPVNLGDGMVDKTLRNMQAPGAGKGQKTGGRHGSSNEMRNSRKFLGDQKALAQPPSAESTVMYQLTVAQAFSHAAQGSSETEEAGGTLMKDTAGLVFDGGREPGSKDSLQGMGGGGTLPGTGDVEALKEQAEEQERKIKKCTDATEAHKTPQQEALDSMGEAIKVAQAQIRDCVDKKHDFWNALMDCLAFNCGASRRRWQRSKSTLAQKVAVVTSYCDKANTHGAAIGAACADLRGGDSSVPIDCAGQGRQMNDACKN
ncbi:MAG: hypothetical protein ABIJ96_00150 [Elusimicrobiota bacterium]